LVSGLALLAGCEKELILDGARFDTRAGLASSLPGKDGAPAVDTSLDFENRSVAIKLPGVTTTPDWTHRAGNPRHLMPNAALSAAPSQVWSVGVGTGNSRKYRITAAPVVAQGRVYTIDATGSLAATSAEGAKLWTTDLKPDGARSTLSGGGLAFGDGLVFATSGYAELLAMDPATGAVIWRQRLGAPASGAPTVANGLVYVSGRDGTAWAIRAKDGSVAWQLAGTPSALGMQGAASPAVADNMVLFAFGSTEVLAVQKDTGAPVWRASVAGKRLGRGYGAVSDITGDPVIAGKTTYVGNQSGRSAALDTATGARIWTSPEAAYGPMLVVGGSVFLINDEARLVRLDAATGAKIWAVEMPYYTKTREKRRARITAHYGPALAGGRLVVASGDGALRLFNAEDGSLAGTLDLPGGAASAPAFAGGAMYVVSAKGQLHAFR
tara:strand:- start:21771 stop:23087 length:1317 start_codon:yes stop_codon:yes gene_type:complete